MKIKTFDVINTVRIWLMNIAITRLSVIEIEDYIILSDDKVIE